MPLRYRVNFGNGQVKDVPSKAEAARALAAHGDDYAFVQWQEPQSGEWFKACGDFTQEVR